MLKSYWHYIKMQFSRTSIYDIPAERMSSWRRQGHQRLSNKRFYLAGNLAATHVTIAKPTRAVWTSSVAARVEHHRFRSLHADLTLTFLNHFV